MKLDYSLSQEDYIDFNLKYILDSKLVRKIFLIQKLAIAFVMAGILFLFYSEYQVSFWFISSVFLVVYLGGSLLEALILSSLLKRKLRSDLIQDEKILAPKSLVLDKEGIHELDGTSDYLVKWKFIKDLVVLEDYIFVSSDLGKGYIIPKKSVEDWQALVELLRENI